MHVSDTQLGPDEPPRGEDLRPRDPRGHGYQNSVPSTRTSVSWTFVAIAIVALVVVLVFILENLHATDATFFGVHWHIPLGLDLLLAALLGAAAVFVVGAAPRSSCGCSRPSHHAGTGRQFAISDKRRVT